MLLLLRFDAPAPGLCREARADRGLPPRKDRVRATPLVGAGVEGAGARDGTLDGDVVPNGESVDGGLRPPTVLTGGFFVAVDMMV